MVLAALVREEERIARLIFHRCRWWVHPWLVRRPTYDHFENLMVKLERELHGNFKGFLRREPDMFHELVQHVGPRIEKGCYSARQPLLPGLKLVITLHFLATGMTYHTLSYSFWVANNTISLFFPKVCAAIVEEYQAEVFVPYNPGRMATCGG